MMKRMYRLFGIKSFAIGCFALLVTACTHFPSENMDPAKNNKANFQKDLKECKEDHPESSAGLHYNRWIDCMNLKGWK